MRESSIAVRKLEIAETIRSMEKRGGSDEYG